jgi:hypothetical protein
MPQVAGRVGIRGGINSQPYRQQTWGKAPRSCLKRKENLTRNRPNDMEKYTDYLWTVDKDMVID